MIDRRRFLEAAEAGLGEVEDFEPPAAQGGITLIHAKERGGEQRRLLPAGAGADLEDGVARVVGILWQQRQLDLLLERGEALAQGLQFVFRKCFQFRIFTRLGEIREAR